MKDDGDVRRAPRRFLTFRTHDAGHTQSSFTRIRISARAEVLMFDSLSLQTLR
jgi:hypothetical protein